MTQEIPYNFSVRSFHSLTSKSMEVYTLTSEIHPSPDSSLILFPLRFRLREPWYGSVNDYKYNKILSLLKFKEFLSQKIRVKRLTKVLTTNTRHIFRKPL